jgi:hypothetical protein
LSDLRFLPSLFDLEASRSDFGLDFGFGSVVYLTDPAEWRRVNSLWRRQFHPTAKSLII